MRKKTIVIVGFINFVLLTSIFIPIGVITVNLKDYGTISINEPFYHTPSNISSFKHLNLECEVGNVEINYDYSSSRELISIIALIRIAGPGSKKMVLGLLVDGDRPRISKEMYKRIDHHLYAGSRFGLVDTAMHEGFDSAYGFFNHLRGLICYVKDVDVNKWNEFNERFSIIKHPLEDNLEPLTKPKL